MSNPIIWYSNILFFISFRCRYVAQTVQKTRHVLIQCFLTWGKLTNKIKVSWKKCFKNLYFWSRKSFFARSIKILSCSSYSMLRKVKNHWPCLIGKGISMYSHFGTSDWRATQPFNELYKCLFRCIVLIHHWIRAHILRVNLVLSYVLKK